MNAFSSKHYNKLAYMLPVASDKAAREASKILMSTEEVVTREQIKRVVDAAIMDSFTREFAKEFSKDNPNFSADVWFKALGVKR